MLGGANQRYPIQLSVPHGPPIAGHEELDIEDL